MSELNMYIGGIREIVQDYETIVNRAREVAVEIGLVDDLPEHYFRYDKVKVEFDNKTHEVVLSVHYRGCDDKYDDTTRVPYDYLLKPAKHHLDEFVKKCGKTAKERYSYAKSETEYREWQKTDEYKWGHE